MLIVCMGYCDLVTTDSAPSSREVLSAYLAGGTPRGGATDAVTEALREAILDGVLRPTSWLREDELARTFTVSRTPVREALRRLSDAGLVTKTANHGTVVASLSLGDLGSLYAVQEHLEGLASRLAATSCPPTLVETLQEIDFGLSDTIAGDDVSAFAEVELEWHRALRGASKNAYLDRFLSQVEHAIRRLPALEFTRPERAHEVLAEHSSIIRAVEAHDSDAAARAMAEHMKRSWEVGSRYLTTYG